MTTMDDDLLFIDDEDDNDLSDEAAALWFDTDESLVPEKFKDDILYFENDLLSFDDDPEDDLLGLDDDPEDDLLGLDDEPATGYRLMEEVNIPDTLEGLIKEAKMHKREGRNPLRSGDSIVRPNMTAYEEFKYWVGHYERTQNPYVEKVMLKGVLMAMRANTYGYMVKCTLPGAQNTPIFAPVHAATEDGGKVELLPTLPFEHRNKSNVERLPTRFAFTISVTKTGTYVPEGVPFTLC